MPILDSALALLRSLSASWPLLAAALLLALLAPPLRSLAGRLAPLALCALALQLWAAALQGLAEGQPDMARLDHIDIGDAAAQVRLGRRELNQLPGLPGSADEQHVFLEQAGRDGWRISNISQRRKLLLSYCFEDAEACPPSGDVSFDADRAPLQAGDAIAFANGAAAAIRVERASLAGESGPRAISLEVPGAGGLRTYAVRWSQDDLAVADGAGVRLLPCEEAKVSWKDGVAKVFRSVVRRLFPGADGAPAAAAALPARLRGWLLAPPADSLVLRLGGALEACIAGGVAMIPAPGSRFNAVEVHWREQVGFVAVRGSEPAAAIRRGGDRLWLGAIAHPLARQLGGRKARLASFIAGHTRYRLEAPPGDGSPGWKGVAFRLAPVAGPHLLPSLDGCKADAAVATLADRRQLGWIGRCAEGPDLLAEWKQPGLNPFAFSLATRPRIAALGALTAGPLLLLALWRMVAALRGRGRTGLVAAGSGVELGLRWFLLLLGLAAMANFLVFKLAALPFFERLLERPELAYAPLSPWPALALWGLACASLAGARGAGLHDNLIMAAWTGIVASGHVAMMALSLDNGDLSRLKFADDTTQAIAAAAGLAIAAAQIGPEALAGAARSLFVDRAGAKGWVGGGLWLLLAAMLGTLAIWFLFGTETGIAGVLQPSEIVKTLLVFVFCAMVAAALGRDGDDGGSRPRAGAVLVPLVFIAFVIGFVLAVPVMRNDLSPFLIMALTVVLSLALGLAIHWMAKRTEWLELADRRPPPPRASQRPPQAGRRWPFWLRRLHPRRWRSLLRWRAASVFAAGDIAALLAIAALAGLAAVRLGEGRQTRASWIEMIGGVTIPYVKIEINIDKPLNRFISWIELNGKDAKGMDVQFPDVGYQVLRSRQIIDESGCAEAWAGLSRLDAGLRLAFAVRCAPGAAVRPRKTPEGVPLLHEAASIPEIQSDFVGTWLVALLGRNGALAVVALQCALAGAMLVAGFRIVKWSPAQTRNRAAAFAAGFASIGFAVMLSLQWLISWSNAFGTVPVMGQPATFLAHGPSHFLLFGAPCVLAAICGLRLRQAMRAHPVPPRIPHLPWRFRHAGR